MTASDENFHDILARLSARLPEDLDAELFTKSAATPGRALPGDGFVPSRILWSSQTPGPARFGVRVTAPPAHPRALAARLAAIAIERQVHPVLISHIGQSGLQRFGFREEQVAGDDETARMLSEEQIRSFWNIAIIVGAEELVNFG